MDRNPENGAEIQNSACGRLGIMMHLRIVNSVRNEEEQEDDEYNIPHGKKVLKELVVTWDNTDMIVCAGSYFSSVPGAENCGSMDSVSLAFLGRQRGNLRWCTYLT